MNGNIYEVIRKEFVFEKGKLRQTSSFSLGLWKDSDKAFDFLSGRAKSQREVWVALDWSVAVDAYRPGIDDDNPEGMTGVLRYVETVSCDVGTKGVKYLTEFSLVERYAM